MNDVEQYGYGYLEEYRGSYIDMKIDNKYLKFSKHCSVEMVVTSRKYLKYSSHKSYGALCRSCFYSDDVTLEKIIEYYTSRFNYNRSFNKLEYNWILDSIEEEIHNGNLRGKYSDYHYRKREKNINEILNS